jgi:protein-tyrosine phosphatase
VIRVLMVCLGNICRSPMARVVAQTYADRSPQATVGRWLWVQSAGTHCTPGQPTDVRARTSLQRRGYELVGEKSRRVVVEDFERFDLILAMDNDNLDFLKSRCTEQHLNKLKLFLDFAPDLRETEVPDPYYGHPQGFERVLDLCEAASRGLITALERSSLDRPL